MPSIYDEQALDALQALKRATPETFKETLTTLFPGWEGHAIIDSIGQARMYTAHQHYSLKVSRAIHDNLPAPFGRRAFDWTRSHGFERVLDFVEWPDRTDQELDDVLAKASAQIERIMVDA